MRVYLDNCCYNRPFDDQNQLKVRLETIAKLEIQKQMRSGEIEYVWSDILANEVEESSFWERRERIEPWVKDANMYVATTPEIERQAELFMDLGVKAADAIHLASAASAACDWFITVDKGILKKIRNVGRMRVANPLEYLQETMP
jgi:predicted nucleic acid-binding protein